MRAASTIRKGLFLRFYGREFNAPKCTRILAAVRQPVERLVIPGPSGTLFVRYCECSSDFILMFEERAASFSLNTLIHLGLTRRESEILRWVAEGKTNPEIGAILGISPRTVQKHLERVYKQLGVENRHAAMRMIFDADSRQEETSKSDV